VGELRTQVLVVGGGLAAFCVRTGATPRGVRADPSTFQAEPVPAGVELRRPPDVRGC
jgi:hypothetical protein